MSGIIGGAGSKSGVIGEDALEIHEWLMNETFNGTAFTNWNAIGGGVQSSTGGWVICPTTYGYKTMGGTMVETDGVFTFPRTGMWQIIFRLVIKQDSGTDRCAAYISKTLNNGSSWGWALGSCQIIHTGVGTNSYQSNTGEAVFNVTDTSTHKIKFIFGDSNNTTTDVVVAGDTSGNNAATAVKFIRIGS